MRFPVNQPYNITTKFNINTHPGIDIAPIPAGTQGIRCYSPEGATVITSNYIASLEGNYVILRGDSGMYYYFGHFAQRLVFSGHIDEGTVIGILGMTGAATGIHTHHEVRHTINGGQIDPEVYYKNIGGSMETADIDFVRKVCVISTGMQPEVSQNFLNNVGLPKDQVLNNFLNYKESTDLRLRAGAYDGLQARIKQLESSGGVAYREAGSLDGKTYYSKI